MGILGFEGFGVGVLGLGCIGCSAIDLPEFSAAVNKIPK